ncbi:MAG: hypothetical protein KDB61_10565, partial [Planctomycetes bacterium]|nr:hypothetical protein [Planctomycetota bacterium]
MIFRIVRSKRFQIVAGCALALTGVGFVWAQEKVDARWQEMQDKLAVMRAELEAESGVREPLGGEGTEGNAWDEYDQAMVWMREDQRGWELGLAAQGASRATRDVRHAETRRLVKELATPLAAVQRGARCSMALRSKVSPEEERARRLTTRDTRALIEVL